MPVLSCSRCGRTTNTAVCDYDLRDLSVGARRCYAAWVDGRWVDGCAMTDPDADRFLVGFARKVVSGGLGRGQG